jgi:hypothetical protein
MLGRSYSWLDQGLRDNKFTLPDGTKVEPRRTAGRYRRFSLAILEDIALELLPARFVPDGEAELHVPRIAYGRTPRDRRVQDPRLNLLSPDYTTGRRCTGPANGLLAAGGSGPSPQGTRSRISGGFRQPADPTL